MKILYRLLMAGTVLSCVATVQMAEAGLARGTRVLIDQVAPPSAIMLAQAAEPEKKPEAAPPKPAAPPARPPAAAPPPPPAAKPVAPPAPAPARPPEHITPPAASPPPPPARAPPPRLQLPHAQLRHRPRFRCSPSPRVTPPAPAPQGAPHNAPVPDHPPVPRRPSWAAAGHGNSARRAAEPRKSSHLQCRADRSACRRQRKRLTPLPPHQALQP